MKYKKYVIAAVVAGICISAVVLTAGLRPKPARQDKLVVQPVKPLLLEKDKMPEVQSNTQQVKQDSRQSQHEPSDAHSEPEAINEQLSLISQDYAAELKYPPYSKPISETNLSYLEPNYYSVVDVPVLDGAETASLSLAKYRYFYPDSVTVSLNTELAVDQIKFEFFEPTTGEVLASKQTDTKSLTVESDESWPQEVRVKATIDFEQGTDLLTADFSFYVPAAYLTTAGAPAARGPDMVIPLSLDVKQAGIYRVRANLLTREGKVIAALNSKSRLETGEQVLDLKVHASVLAQTDGHYQLRHWVIEKMSGYPGEKASFGVSIHDTIMLAPFNLSTLSQEPYMPSAEEQQRLEFLRKAAGQ